jgi:hypothetical protein
MWIYELYQVVNTQNLSLLSTFTILTSKQIEVVSYRNTTRKCKLFVQDVIKCSFPVLSSKRCSQHTTSHTIEFL